ncbi:MAG: CDP-diacylglycerol--serine O-phosphatidyltransferase, partial [Theionarchaea archaeon]|nr:CDP-diacylglycerol--serine O-phosphatidyltransferase [Theionarchaea archaeon]
DIAARLILVAIVADGFDGYIARKSMSESDFGMNFDSLSDCISFGIAPALLMYSYVTEWWVIGVSLLYVGAGVLRLSRYNVSAHDVEEGIFIGMPIPLGALFMVLAIFGELPQAFVVGAALVISYLMVCSINFAKIRSSKFPVQNLAVLCLVAIPYTYLIPVARLAFAGCSCGIFMRKKRNNH